MSGRATEAGAAQGKSLNQVSLGILREGWDRVKGDLTLRNWKKREQTLLHQPLAASSACHLRDGVVAPCALFSVVAIYGLIEPCYTLREGIVWVAAVKKESITQSASSLLPLGSCCFCSRSSFWQKFNTAPTFKEWGGGMEREGESRIKEELPCPRLPLARSPTAASKKRIRESKLPLPVQQQCLLWPSFQRVNKLSVALPPPDLTPRAAVCSSCYIKLSLK